MSWKLAPESWSRYLHIYQHSCLYFPWLSVIFKYLPQLSQLSQILVKYLYLFILSSLIYVVRVTFTLQSPFMYIGVHIVLLWLSFFCVLQTRFWKCPQSTKKVLLTFSYVYSMISYKNHQSTQKTKHCQRHYGPRRWLL